MYFAAVACLAGLVFLQRRHRKDKEEWMYRRRMEGNDGGNMVAME